MSEQTEVKDRKVLEKRKRGATNNKSALKIVALATSAGGLNALGEVLSGLSDNFPATIVIVQHLAPHCRSLMADILSRRTPLLVKEAEEGDCLCAGSIYVAPPNYHLLVNPNGTLSLSQSERVHFLRPAADILFNSIAANHKDRAIAIVLTGTGNDGSLGVQAIKKMGGTIIVQDEETSEFFGMPNATIQSGCVDYILPLFDISKVLISLVT